MGNCASLLRQKLEERRALPVPGCYDALSARVIEAAGFEAVGITSFGLAGSLLGKPDFGLLEMADILRNTWNVARAVAIPVIADIETGGGNALNVIEVIEKLIAIGIAGVNIEDQLFPSRCGHLEGKQVVSAEEMAGKVRAIASVRKRLGADLVIIARTDACAVYGLTEAIRRANIYL
ncbi:MAG TPA: isocitrate lyase/PEP mutase family protein, partial [Bryobacteraceae bacterium]|nr:isocitrate lyase/PEP mutase family protein [Bryobacteraceae bacterium]